MAWHHESESDIICLWISLSLISTALHAEQASVRLRPLSCPLSDSGWTEYDQHFLVWYCHVTEWVGATCSRRFTCQVSTFFLIPIYHNYPWDDEVWWLAIRFPFQCNNWPLYILCDIMLIIMYGAQCLMIPSSYCNGSIIHVSVTYFRCNSFWES